MNRTAILVAVCASVGLPAVVGAVPTIQIDSPVDGTCVNSGQPVVEGTIGGEPLLAAAEVEVLVTVTSAVDGEARVALRVDEVEVNAQGVVLLAGQPTPVTLFAPADAVEDGPGRTLEATVEAPDGEAEDAVTVTLDRRPPDVVFSEEVIALQGTCAEIPPEVEFEVSDIVDPDPLVESRLEVSEEGCTVTRVITVRDSCAGGEFEGNAQELRFITRQPTDAAPQIVFAGIREEERLLEGRLNYTLGVPADCVVQQTARYVRNQDEPRPMGDGELFDRSGDYVASVEVEACGHAPVAAERRFTVVPAPRVDAGGPYVTQQGAELILDAGESEIPVDVVGEVVEYAWDIPVDGFFDPEEGRAPQVPFDTNRPDGEYDVGLRITTDGEFIGYDFTVVTIRDVDPQCDAGGPYAAVQGEPIRFDASGSSPGVPAEPIVAYGWDFGDGEGRRTAVPETSHDYLEEGVYEVTLVVEDEDSPSEPCQAQVIVGDVDPVVEGIAALGDAIEGVPLRFTAGATSAGSAAEPLVGYRWDFGDGESAEGPALRGPEHTYLDDGPVQVCLDVSDVDSSARACIDLVVADLVPTARCSGPGFAVEGREVVFDARGSRAGGAADPLARYVWDFGDGTDPVVVEDAASTTVNHAFARDGDLVVTLTVEDEDSSVTAECPITVDDATPDARFVIDSPIAGAVEGQAITLDATGSVAGGGDAIVEYQWDLGDGTRLVGPDLDSIEYAWPDQGEYTVELRLVDSDGSVDVARNFVTVLNRAPQNVRIVGPARVEIGQRNTWRVEYDDVPADVPVIDWRMGDGATFQDRPEVQHTYVEVPRIGRVTLRVSVDDQDGGVTQVEMPVEITAAGPSVEGPTELDAVENQPLEAEWLLVSAPGNNGPDGPLDVIAPTVPAGAEVIVEAGQPANARRIVRLRWTPGADDAGEHRFLFVATAPSGLERVWPVTIRVADDRGAWLAAAGGDIQSGRVSLYRFDRIAGLDVSTFDLAGEIIVPGGAYAPTLGPFRRLHVAAPGAGALVSIDLSGERPRLGRRLPLEGRPMAVAAGPAHIWLAGAGWLHAVHARTLKPAVSLPVDARLIRGLAWVPDAADGDPLLLGADADGELLVLDPERALAEREPVVARHPLGVSLGRVVTAAGRWLVLDGAGRQIIEVDPSGLLGETEDLIVDRWPVPFAPIDATIQDDALWFTSSRGLERIGPAGEAELVDDGAAIGVAALPEGLYGRTALAIGGRDRVSNRSLDGGALDAVRGGGGRQLLFFEIPAR